MRDRVMFSLKDAIDGGSQSGCHLFFAVGEDGGPGGVEEDVADAGLAVEKNRDAALEGFDCRDAVALDGGHEKKMGLRKELFQVIVGDEAVEVNAVSEAEIPGHLLKSGDEGTFAGEVELPVDAGGERGFGSFKFCERADHPIDALVGFDAADGEHTELLVVDWANSQSRGAVVR